MTAFVRAICASATSRSARARSSSVSADAACWPQRSAARRAASRRAPPAPRAPSAPPPRPRRRARRAPCPRRRPAPGTSATSRTVPASSLRSVTERSASTVPIEVVVPRTRARPRRGGRHRLHRLGLVRGGRLRRTQRGPLPDGQHEAGSHDDDSRTNDRTHTRRLMASSLLLGISEYRGRRAKPFECARLANRLASRQFKHMRAPHIDLHPSSPPRLLCLAGCRGVLLQPTAGRWRQR